MFKTSNLPSIRFLRFQVSALRLQREHAAFTLIELLVVISIIAILAGLSFPAVQGALGSSKRAQARNDVNQVAAAVKSYSLEYGRLPKSGTTAIKELTGDNPKGIVFFEAKKASGTPPKGGLSADGSQLLDPWGYEYAITLDDDYDNKVNNILTTVIVESKGDPNQNPRQTISNVK